MVNLDQTAGHPTFLHPYTGMVPLNQVRYPSNLAFDLTHPYGMAPLPAYRVATAPIAPMVTITPTNLHFVKREAEPESPYIIKTKMDNPVDGSQQEVQIKVDQSGKGQSFQHVEQKDQHKVTHDNYIMEHRRMVQRPLISKMYMVNQRGMDMNHPMTENTGAIHDQIPRNQVGMVGNQIGVNQMGMYRNQEQGMEDQVMLQKKHDTMLVENVGHRTDKLRDQIVTRPRQMDNGQQLGMNQMVQLINHNLKNAVEIHSETGKNMMTALESHEELGQNLRDAIKLYESTPATLGSRRYSNMRDAMVMNNNQMVGHNMREGQMIHHQNQMIRPQNQMIHTQQM